MAQEIIDISGNVYGFLKVIKLDHVGNRRRSYWECECLRCGKHKVIRKDSFIYPYSKVKSCGCWHIYESSKRKRNEQTGMYVGGYDEKYYCDGTRQMGYASN